MPGPLRCLPGGSRAEGQGCLIGINPSRLVHLSETLTYSLEFSILPCTCFSFLTKCAIRSFQKSIQMNECNWEEPLSQIEMTPTFSDTGSWWNWWMNNNCCALNHGKSIHCNYRHICHSCLYLPNARVFPGRRWFVWGGKDVEVTRESIINILFNMHDFSQVDWNRLVQFDG